MAGLVLTAVLALAQGLSDPGARPLEAGRRALEGGRTEEATHHLLEAWAWRGAEAELALLLARAAERDAAPVWAHAYAGLACDARGKVKLPRELGDDDGPADVAAARAAAVGELVKLAESRERKGRREPAELVVARWLRRTALAVARDAPALVGGEARDTVGEAALDPRLSAPPDAHAGLIRALELELARARAGGRTGDAIEVARALRGLARQAGLEDLVGEAPPGMDQVEERAAAALAELRGDLDARPWTVAELDALLERDRAAGGRAHRDAFTRAHASMGRPAVAVSPHGLYRIETECGFETLHGVARTIEHHHARLVDLYGRDPFAGSGEVRQGTVRVVPEAYGLEAEGAPYWWAGGFQSGDVTAVRFSIGGVEALGRGLVHELTHRFDGALYPGQMAWLSEGKAVWTAGAYGGWRDARFVPDHASFGTIERAWLQGYGGVDELKELIDGTIEDYRDNYFAGYALYVFLTTAEDGVYAARFDEYLTGGFRGNRDPLAWFGRHFVDGRDGRPETLEELAERFGTWLGGFYWQDRKPWTERYTQDVPDSAERGWIYDAPTWTWSRARAEPSFGQDQAREAARLLARLGREREAADAYVWGLSQDGRSPRAERELAALLEGLGDGDAAWALRAELAPDGAAAATPLRLPRTHALLAELAAAAGECEERGLARAAATLAADHDRLAARLGAAPLARGGAVVARPAEPLGPGWVEDGLTGYEERRVAGLWYAGEDGALHVGRERPREGTGTMDRRAHQRHAFTRSTRWLLPGRYVVAMQVQLTTSFVDGCVVVGYTRRDRNVRVQLTAGDFLYAIGAAEGAEEIESIGWRVDGLYDRDGALPGARPGGRVELGRPVTAVQVELLVDGARLEVRVDGEPRGTYHTPDGAPIEGYVGFATGMGAIKVQRPTVQRLDREAFAERGRDPAGALLLNHAFRGDRAPPSQGMLFLRMAQPDDEEEGYVFEPDRWVRKAVRAATALEELARKEDVRQPWALAVSERLAGEPLEALRAELRAALGREPDLLTVPVTPPPAADDPDAREKEKELDTSWLVLIDPSGVVRVRDEFFGFERAFTDRMEHWLTVLRENGFPARELPPIEPAEPAPPEEPPRDQHPTTAPYHPGS